MAQQLLSNITNPGAEGAHMDPLRSFFIAHKRLKIEWYRTIVDNYMDFDDLMESNENDLRNMLSHDCKLSTIATTRIINAVRKIPQSLIHKEANSKKVSIVSNEEHCAAQKLKSESAKMFQYISDVTNTLKKMDENAQIHRNEINKTFNQIVDNANKRRKELLSQLNTIRDDKYRKLTMQQKILEAKKKRMIEFYAETQRMMKDTNMDANKRKIKIMAQTKRLLDGQKRIELYPSANEDFTVRISVNPNMFNRIGCVGDGMQRKVNKVHGPIQQKLRCTQV